MSFDNATVWEVNGGIGSDTANGGGFSPTCAGFATDGSATLANTVAPVFTSASYNFISRDEGHYLFIQAGTSSRPGWWLIASTSGNAATLTATAGTGVLYNGATPTNITDGISNPTPTLSSVTWGIDYSRKTAPAIAYTDMVVGATTTQFTSALNVVGPNIIGNVIKVTSGATVQRVQVVSTSTITATCDKTLGTAAQVGAGGLGGALATPGLASGLTTSLAWIATKGSNTYNMTSSSNVSGGRMAPSTSCLLFGYSTNRYPYNLDANRPVFQSTGGNGFSLFTVGNPNTSCHCIDFENGNSGTTIKGFDDGAGGWGNSDLWNCKFNGISIAFDIRVNSTVDYCWVNACTSGASAVVSDNSDTFKNCVFTANTTLTFSAKAVKRSTFYNNGSNSSGMVTTVKTIDECLFHTTTGASNIIAQNCVAIENSIFVNNAAATSSCISGLASDNTAKVVNCGFYNNTQDVVTGSTYPGFRVVNKIVLTADPCTAVSSGDFSLNNTAGGGVLLRGLGFPVTFANGLTTNALDVGPAQRASSSGATAYAF